ncbi:unnamed protein product [Triticum turgidum subsp. durum]|uniref:TF-B3 domain-containing protein n=1 Tax=Triticum turgidum subsp. durum TaxID=4567 RepID=A0A9R1PPL3_TRITD|nr:unnamed protein product [Triticum turgidum subsp. durum]
MAEPIPTDSSTTVTPPVYRRRNSSEESRGISSNLSNQGNLNPFCTAFFDAGGKDHGVASSAGETSQAAISAGPPDKLDPESAKACLEVEKTQPRILPLLGKPYFACVVCKSHVQQPFQVVVPRSLAPFLPSKPTPATLTWQGRTWEMRFTGGRHIQRLEAGWRSFALDNALRLGDGCVFELVGGDGESIMFRVQVLRAEIPASIRQRAGGYTPSSAIVLD